MENTLRLPVGLLDLGFFVLSAQNRASVAFNSTFGFNVSTTTLSELGASPDSPSSTG